MMIAGVQTAEEEGGVGGEAGGKSAHPGLLGHKLYTRHTSTAQHYSITVDENCAVWSQACSDVLMQCSAVQ